MKQLLSTLTVLTAFAVNAQLSGLGTTLSSPYEGDTVEQPPTFVWQNASDISDQRLSQQLIVVEIQEGQSASEAVAVNVPVFMRQELQASTLPFSATDYELKKGVWYAWQVSTLFSGVVAQQSDVWTFILADPRPPTRTFVPLRRQSDGAFHHIKGRELNISTVEKGLLGLKATILTPDGRCIEVNLTELADGKPIDQTESKTSTEMRYFTLDLKNSKLKKGLYTFEWNPTGKQSYTLHFELI